ncbi:MAG: hypothetical protein H0T71_01210 [Acidobacteria bacterium]|nr:hypothetical protein [Acidobacteriota bacterium]
MKHVGLMIVALTVGVSLSGGPAGAVQDAPRKLVAPVRGEANIELTAPDTKVVGNNVVTTIRVRNVAKGPIAGFRVTENWFDRDRNAVPGDVYRHPRPIAPNEVVTVTLTTPRRAGMGDNRYDFSHANGSIKTAVVKTLPAPAKPTT